MKTPEPFVPPAFDAAALEEEYIRRAKTVARELRFCRDNPGAYTDDEYADLLGEIWALSDLSPGAAYVFIDFILDVSAPSQGVEP